MVSQQSQTAFHIAGLLDKMGSGDKDFRFMAVSDFTTEFSKGGLRLDDDSERKIVQKLIGLLEDKNGEVQNLAVRALGTIATRCSETNCESVVDALCNNLVSKSEEHREVSSTALSTFVKALPSGTALSTKIAISLLPKLHIVLNKLGNETAAKNEILDIIGEVLLRNGASLSAHHTATEAVLLEHVRVGRPAVRKRAIAALSHLAAVAANDLFNDIVTRVIEMLKAPEADARILVSAITALARASSARFALFLPSVLPTVLGYADNSDDELREAAIQGLEVMVERCTKQTADFFPDIEKKISTALVHDPNYSYDDSEEESMETGDEEADEDEEGDDYEDDDDFSWKVRRAAAKAIQANLDNRREEQASLAQRFGPLLISRLKEREDNVREEVFAAYSTLLKKLHSSRDPSVIACVQKQIPSLLKAVVRALKAKSSKSRQLSFQLLTHLVRAIPGSLGGLVSPILGGVTAMLGDKTASAQMKIDVLVFLEEAINSHPHDLFASQTASLVPLVANAAADSFYKVSSQALVVISLLLDVLKAKGSNGSEVEVLCSAAFDKVKGDVDQEVKDKAILAIGNLLHHFDLGQKAEEMLKVLVERIKNEATRLTAVKAIRHVVESENSKAVAPLLPSLIPLLSDLLKKNSRALKISALSLLLSLAEKTPSALDASFVATLPPLISESDIQITQISLRILTVACENSPQALSSKLQEVLVAIGDVSKSTVLQGSTLTSVLEFLTALVKKPVPGKPDFETLLDRLSLPIYESRGLPRPSFHSISAMVATVAAADNNASNAPMLAEKLAEQLSNPKANDNVRLFALLSLGELGRRIPTIYGGKLKPESLIVEAFNSANEDIKSAAAQALGGLAVGNLGHYLPFILKQIDEQPKKQYLLLHALKEVIICETSRTPPSPSFVQQVDAIWAVLVKHADTAEEGTRCVVAECLGKLCHVSPETLLPRLKEYVSSPSLNMRAAVVTSVKFMISDEKKTIDNTLQKMMGDFLLAADENLDVRRVALVVLNSAAHNKPQLIRGHLSSLMPIVYKETNVRPELIREVEMGPFKHTVDDGLDLRKSAFECMYTLLDSCLESLDLSLFMACLDSGLKDHHDIKLLAFLTLSKLCTLAPAEVSQRIDKICEPLKAQLLLKPKQNAVKQELEKADELKRAILRTLVVLQKLPDAMRMAQVNDLRSVASSSTELRTVYDNLLKGEQRPFAEVDA